MSVRTTAEFLIKQYGNDGFSRLVEAFRAQEPNPELAKEFQVSRQRIWQLKTMLGRQQVSYVLHPEVEELLGIYASGRKSI